MDRQIDRQTDGIHRYHICGARSGSPQLITQQLKTAQNAGVQEPTTTCTGKKPNTTCTGKEPTTTCIGK